MSSAAAVVGVVSALAEVVAVTEDVEGAAISDESQTCNTREE